jgi:hypothetical protein
MTSHLSDNHSSYRNHRRQVWIQIYVPILFTVVIGAALAIFIGITTFGDGDNSQRWAAISTIWLVIPVLIFGLLFGVVLTMAIYLMARLLNIIPPYSGKAQYYVIRTTQKTRTFSDLAVKPVLFLEGILASIQAFFGRK